MRRWPGDSLQHHTEAMNPRGWKAAYMHRDAIELGEATRGVAPYLHPMYVQMATAKRSEALGIRGGAREGLFRAPVGPSSDGPTLGSRVEAFRRERGLEDACHHACHACPTGTCSFTHLEPNAWICEATGFVHVCDESCMERGADNLCCPISGRVFDGAFEEGEGGGDGERQQEEGRGDDWNVEEGIGGECRLATVRNPGRVVQVLNLESAALRVAKPKTDALLD